MTAAIDPTTERPGEEPDADDGADLPNLPLLDDAIEHDAAAEVKPTWRGWIHAGTFPLAIVLGIVLLVFADGMAARVSGAVFFASSLLLFGVSALYHRFNWSPTIKRLLKRADHSNIFLLIAGTYTPLAVLCLPESKATLLLWLVWGGAALVAAGLALQSIMVTANSFVQVGTEPAMRGRVMALYMTIFVAGTPIGAPLMGWIANTFGPRVAIAVGAAAALVAAAIGLAFYLRTNDVRLRWTRSVPLRLALSRGDNVASARGELALDEVTARKA